jgi:UDP-N-acetylmuramyl pentapeptide phosphotransferase/UDP-N-acetylglucosamine-1-phosphate transferase
MGWSEAQLTLGAALASYVLCRALIPTLRRLFLVEPTARSSHLTATPQGGGLLVVGIALVSAMTLLGGRNAAAAAPFGAAALGLLALGCADDIWNLSPKFRLFFQGVAVAVFLIETPSEWRNAIPMAPTALIFVLLMFATLWFINLTNFMDGLDLMTVAEFVPAFGASGLLLPSDGASQIVRVVCLATGGALIGFAGVNKPTARLFLGDSGSLPIGLIGAVAILALNHEHGAATALLPFLYYIADSTLTLARRALKGEKVWRAHRTHFYQMATTNGLSTKQVIARVVVCNVTLCSLAIVTAFASLAGQIAVFLFGVLTVALLLHNLARPRTQ